MAPSSSSQPPAPQTDSSAPSTTVSSRQTSEEYSAASTTSMTSAPPTVAVEKNMDESSKFRTFLSILKRFIGVADMAAVRFSLPAQLLEPIPNLEYWHYLDRPETFACIGDSQEPLGRMLAALRFWFTKDLKYVKGKPCKPYNSTLGEFFRCNWTIDETAPTLAGPASTQADAKLPVTVSYLTEQTSHHPPVSAYYIDCPEKGISGRGYDQLSANFTGTRIRVGPGQYNHGIYVTLHEQDETYNLTHPVAHLGGLLRGSLHVTVSDHCYVTCPKTRLKAILYYLEEGWLGKIQNRVQGVIFPYDPDNDTRTRLKDVPEGDILARIEGCWHEQVYFTLGGKPFDKTDKAERNLMIDLTPLHPIPKTLPPRDAQLPNESPRFWHAVTTAILDKQYGAATSAKQEIEDRQRRKAAERKDAGAEWSPRFFTGAVTPEGSPELTPDGRDALQRQHQGDWQLVDKGEYAAF